MINKNLISRFSSITRFSGSFLFQQETVPDHCSEMALLCINFSELVPESNVRDMCYRCVIHDLEEVLTTDITRHIKYHDPKIKELIDKAGFEMLSDETSSEFAYQVFHAKDHDTIEGFLVYLADRIQCFLKMTREVEEYGNRQLKRDLEVFKSNIYLLFNEIDGYDKIADQSKKNLKDYLNILITTI